MWMSTWKTCRADGLKFEALSTIYYMYARELVAEERYRKKGAKLYHADDKDTLHNLLIVSHLRRIAYAVF